MKHSRCVHRSVNPLELLSGESASASEMGPRHATLYIQICKIDIEHNKTPDKMSFLVIRIGSVPFPHGHTCASSLTQNFSIVTKTCILLENFPSGLEGPNIMTGCTGYGTICISQRLFKRR